VQGEGVDESGLAVGRQHRRPLHHLKTTIKIEEKWSTSNKVNLPKSQPQRTNDQKALVDIIAKLIGWNFTIHHNIIKISLSFFHIIDIYNVNCLHFELFIKLSHI
jgi:hypothetical protein